ncbi:hypothetical protein ACWEQD_06585 [Rhodococcus pyridinivorans]
MAFTTAIAFPASYPLRLIWLAVWSAVDPDDSSAALTEAALYPVWFARNLLRDRLNVLVPGGAGRAARRGHAERMREIAEVKRRLEVRPHERDGAVQSIRERDRELRARSA